VVCTHEPSSAAVSAMAVTTASTIDAHRRAPGFERGSSAAVSSMAAEDRRRNADVLSDPNRGYGQVHMAKKFIPKPTVLGALALAQHVLANEEVRKRLMVAPVAVLDWANKQRAQRRNAARRGLPDPTSRFGQKSLERRVESLGVVVERAFPDPADPGRLEVVQAVESLRVALAIAAPMPFVQRKKAHRRIDSQLDQMEAAMVDAVLPR
jgi:hypothetical protein